MGEYFTYYYPHVMALAFLATLYFTDLPAKGEFFLRAMAALTIATVLAHVNRWFGIWPDYPFFPSGHMTFCLGLALSLGMLQRWTLVITLPLLIPFAKALNIYGFHTYLDIEGAIPLVLVVYGIVHWFWRIPFARPPLDMAADSP